jgi:hypothetical protein
MGSDVWPGGGGADPGTRLTAAVDQGALDFTGLNGAAAGGYYLEGVWVTNGTADGNLAIQINGVTTGYTGGLIYATSSVLAGQTQDPGGGATTIGALLGRSGLAASGRDRLAFHAWISPADGSTGVVLIEVHSEAYLNSTKADFEAFHLTAAVAISGPITELKIVPTSGVNTDIKAGSWARLQRTGLTA